MIKISYEHDTNRLDEWIETNGLGGYAAGTLSGIRTRKYHGLFNAALKPPVHRFHTLADMDVSFRVNDRWIDLSTHRYTGAVYPKGYRFLREFSLDPWPVFLYEAEGVRVTKEICMVRNRDITLFRLKFETDKDVELRINPLVTVRDHHSIVMENHAIRREPLNVTPEYIEFKPYPAAPSFCIHHQANGFHHRFDWYRNFWFENEDFRGLPAHESAASYGFLKYHLKGKKQVDLMITRDTEIRKSADSFFRNEKKRRAARIKPFKNRTRVVQNLVRAQETYIVRRNKRDYSIIAGYPWFTDWGRDTMISLAGLALSIPGEEKKARSILMTFGKYLDRGMIPNHFPDGNSNPVYNTVDAPLWFVIASYNYYEATRDRDFVKKYLWKYIQEILKYYQEGTRYNIGMDPKDGLVSAGEEGTQLTWMDAKVNGWVVTPRIGKPVEINALWYNALLIGAKFASLQKNRVRKHEYETIARKVKRSFGSAFWLKKKNYLGDVLVGKKMDSSLRPNQLLALSLPFPLISRTRGKKIIERVRKELLTQTGLRTLNRRNKNYRGHYGGDQVARDAAYHQGTVWPWLWGPYLSALVYVYGKKDRTAMEEIRNIFEDVNRQFTRGCIGQVAEIFEGSAPENERGCFAQAWSIAEPLRVAMRLKI